MIGKSAAAADIINSVLLPTVRVNYSMPPAHGAAIVETVLGSEELTAQWHGELARMRDRINGMRQLLVDKLAEHGVKRACPGRADRQAVDLLPECAVKVLGYDVAHAGLRSLTASV